jgi:hypothetical protein
MSTATTALNTSNQLNTNYDFSKVFLGENRYENATLLNADEAEEITFPAGTLLGRIGASNKVVPLTSAATDGSQFPVGVLATNITLAAEAEGTVSMCVAGDVALEKVTLQGADTMATVVSTRTIQDRIGADTVGIKLVSTTDLTGFDNQ